MGYPVFPNVPQVPGVPTLLRFPTSLPTAAQMVGSITGTMLSVTSVSQGLLLANSVLSGTGLISGTKVIQQVTGAIGGIGDYLVDQAQSFAGSIASQFTPPSLEEVPALTSDSPTLGAITGNTTAQQWGIFDADGNSVITADTTVSISYDQDWRIATFPIEEGSFNSYDKVDNPSNIRLRFASGGSVSNKTSLLTSIMSISGDLNLYTVITPEVQYINQNIGRYTYDRNAVDGKGVLKVDVELLQIRQTATATTSNTAQPEGKGQTNGGTKQPQPATPQQQTSVIDDFGNWAENILGLN